MQGEWIALSDSGDFAMEAYRVIPRGLGGRATIILLQEIFGVNQPMRDVAHKLAAHGYEVLVPDLFWRAAPRIDLGYSGEDRARAAQFMSDFDTDLGLADIVRAIGWLKSARGSGHKLAALGFCLGGKLATILGARGQVDCGVSFYGVELDAYVEEIGRTTSRLLLHFGAHDAQIPLELVSRIEAASRGNARAEIHVHDGAQHGFFNPSRPERYHAEAAAAAERRSLEVLREVLA